MAFHHIPTVVRGDGGRFASRFGNALSLRHGFAVTPCSPQAAPLFVGFADIFPRYRGKSALSEGGFYGIIDIFTHATKIVLDVLIGKTNDFQTIAFHFFGTKSICDQPGISEML